MGGRGRLYACAKCSDPKGSKGDLRTVKQHRYAVHVDLEEAPYFCRPCGYRHRRRNGVLRHMRSREHRRKTDAAGITALVEKGRPTPPLIGEKGEDPSKYHILRYSAEESSAYWRAEALKAKREAEKRPRGPPSSSDMSSSDEAPSPKKVKLLGKLFGKTSPTCSPSLPVGPGGDQALPGRSTDANQGLLAPPVSKPESQSPTLDPGSAEAAATLPTCRVVLTPVQTPPTGVKAPFSLDIVQVQSEGNVMQVRPVITGEAEVPQATTSSAVEKPDEEEDVILVEEDIVAGEEDVPEEDIVDLYAEEDSENSPSTPQARPERVPILEQMQRSLEELKVTSPPPETQGEDLAAAVQAFGESVNSAVAQGAQALVGATDRAVEQVENLTTALRDGMRAITEAIQEGVRIQREIKIETAEIRRQIRSIGKALEHGHRHGDPKSKRKD